MTSQAGQMPGFFISPIGRFGSEWVNEMPSHVEVEPVLQELNGEVLARGANKAPDARLDVHARGFWARQSSAYFDIRVCHPNAESYQDLALEQLYQSMITKISDVGK